ncbi:MAG: HlyD family efflux transporter periplasmic adaptor subunit, partial [Candidatus Moranbacteria bacterium]|nr:HlyD family efflux transporter periplasmic adaptor subunit [Candidatus Moranbacteria bacterium]
MGQQVHEGDVLIIQDTKDIDIAINKNVALLRQAQADTIQTESNFNANFIKIRAEYDKGILNYQRYSKLYEMGAISKIQLEAMEQNMVDARSAYEAMSNQMLSESNSATVEMKRQNVNQINYSIEQLEVQRNDYLIKAPIEGTIAYRKAETGAYVQAGQKLLTLISKKQFYIDCILPEQEVAFIKTGMILKVNVSALGRDYSGKIIFVSPMNEEGTK